MVEFIHPPNEWSLFFGFNRIFLNKRGGIMPDNHQGYNQSDIVGNNRTLLLRLLCRQGVCPRVSLSRQSGLKQSTVTNITAEFIRWGLVRETGFMTGSKGRRSIGISLNNDDFGILSIRLARTHFALSIFNLSVEKISEAVFEIPLGQEADRTSALMCEAAEELIRRSAPRRILACGIAVPGPYSASEHRIALMTGTTGWDNIQLRGMLRERLGIPVFAEQDANCGALAQYWLNPDLYSTQMLIYVAVGEGVGAGIIDSGRLVRGRLGMAGEIGHASICYDGPRCACGNRGCLENYCSSTAFARLVNEALSPAVPLSFRDCASLLQSGNETAREIFLSLCERLAVGIVNLINSFNPDIIILGDKLTHVMPDLMVETVRAAVKTRCIPELFENTRIEKSLVTRDSFPAGAALRALEDIFHRPAEYFCAARA